MLGVEISRDLIFKEVVHCRFGKLLALFELLRGLFDFVFRHRHR